MIHFIFVSGDSPSSCSEEDVLLADTNSITGEICTNTFDATKTLAFDNHQHHIPHNQQREMCEVAATVSAVVDLKMDTEIESEELDYHESSEIDEMEHMSDDKVSKHHEDAANNNGSDGNDDDDGAEEKSSHVDPQEGAFPPGYFSLEALQKMAQFVSATMANNSDNEDAQKQLAVLQSTLFTLQHQQLFQLQLIQQLQSQLSINRSEKDENEEDDDDDEREEGELTAAQMAEEQRKYEEEQRQIRKEEEDRLKAKRELVASNADKDMPLNPNMPTTPSDTMSAMESSFSSAFASTIITNHDQPSSMDGLNSLEMLQKRAEEVLDSASRGILSGSLTDEMSFKNDGKGRNEPFFKHRCRYCGKVFGSDSALQIHIRSHTGERPFKCNVCGSRFTTKGNLKVHFQRHTQKFPHIHMNPNPIPEHLDKFYPPLLPPLPPGQQPPLSPPPAPQPATARPPVPMNLPFPPIPGLPPGLQAFQGIPGLPLFRPPFDLLKQMGAHPFFGAMRDAVHQQDAQENHEQEAPADLSKPSTIPSAVAVPPKSQSPPQPRQRTPTLLSPSPPALAPTAPPHRQSETPVPSDLSCQSTAIIKEEPKEEYERVSPMLSSQHESTQHSPEPTRLKSIEQKQVEELIEKHRKSMSPKIWKDDKKDCISPTKSIDDLPVRQAEQPENLSKISVKHLSPSSIGSRERDYHHHHYHDHHNEIKIFPSMLPRPGSTDNSWESYIEVDKSSETTKLQQLVDNIENKITDPNECVVCHKVLSCRSALQMHYRTHTGERPFRCKICGRAFTTKGNLKTHMSVHRMKPPMRTIHQCPVCHKKYSSSPVLQQHIRLHTGEPIDMTLEQIQAAEIRDFPSLSPGTFPMGLNPFAFPMLGMHGGGMGGGPESSNGDNDEFMDEDFDDGSNFDENMSEQADSVSGDSNQNISTHLTRVQIEESHARAFTAMMAERSKSVESLSRAPSTTSHIESVEEKCSSPRTPPQVSPVPSDVSQGALDLTPRSEPKLSPPMQQHRGETSPSSSVSSITAASLGATSSAAAGMASFPNFPFMPHVSTSSSPMSMSSTLNSLAQSVAPMGPFNPMALAGK